MGVSYAEPADLAARWRPLTPVETATAEVLLGDASAIIRAECPDVEGRLAATPPGLDEAVVKFVACSMVKRAMLAAGTEGVSSQMNVAGPFTQQRSFANPMGNLYLTKQDKRLLGCGGQQAFTVDMGPFNDGDPDPLNGWELA